VKEKKVVEHTWLYYWFARVGDVAALALISKQGRRLM
jgi:hypothetical protein